jgi:hypothetical protein
MNKVSKSGVSKLYIYSMIKTIGYTLFLVCCIAFLSILIVPLLGFSGKQIATITIVLIIVGEVTFYASLVFLGKSFYKKIKDRFVPFFRSAGRYFVKNEGVSTTGKQDAQLKIKGKPD